MFWERRESGKDRERRIIREVTEMEERMLARNWMKSMREAK